MIHTINHSMQTYVRQSAKFFVDGIHYITVVGRDSEALCY